MIERVMGSSVSKRGQAPFLESEPQTGDVRANEIGRRIAFDEAQPNERDRRLPLPSDGPLSTPARRRQPISAWGQAN
jgi:hypothetical protein